MTVKSRAGQGRAGQGRAGQGRAGQGRAGQGNKEGPQIPHHEGRFVFGGSGGIPPGGSGAPSWQNPGSRGLPGGSEGATPPIFTKSGQNTHFWSRGDTAKLSSNPYRVREAKCLLGTLASRRAAGAGREDPQPDGNPFQLRFCCQTHFSAELRGEAEGKKAPLEGGLGGEP